MLVLSQRERMLAFCQFVRENFVTAPGLEEPKIAGRLDRLHRAVRGDAAAFASGKDLMPRVAHVGNPANGICPMSLKFGSGLQYSGYGG